MAAMGYKISSLSSISWRQPFASHEFFKMVFKLKLFKFFFYFILLWKQNYWYQFIYQSWCMSDIIRHMTENWACIAKNFQGIIKNLLTIMVGGYEMSNIFPTYNWNIESMFLVWDTVDIV